MPYSIKELQSKETYKNILDSDKNELKEYFEDEELKAAISGSTPDAIRTLRSADGFILSYEDPNNLGETYPSNLMNVRVPMVLYRTNPQEVEQKLEKDMKFGSFRPNEPNESEDNVDALKEELRLKILEYDDPTFSTGPTGGKLQQIASQEEKLNEAIAALEAKIAEL